MITLWKNFPGLQGSWLFFCFLLGKDVATLFTGGKRILFSTHEGIAVKVFQCSVLANSPIS